MMDGSRLLFFEWYFDWKSFNFGSATQVPPLRVGGQTKRAGGLVEIRGVALVACVTFGPVRTSLAQLHKRRCVPNVVHHDL